MQAVTKMKVVDVHFLGRGFYHVEFAPSEMAQSIIRCRPVDMRGSMDFFNTWKQGFLPEDAIISSWGKSIRDLINVSRITT